MLYVIDVGASEGFRGIRVLSGDDRIGGCIVCEDIIEFRKPCNHALDLGLLQLGVCPTTSRILDVEVGTVDTLGLVLQIGSGYGCPLHIMLQIRGWRTMLVLPDALHAERF